MLNVFLILILMNTNVTVHVTVHNRHNSVFAVISKARAWAATTISIGPRPEQIGCHHSTSDRGISSTLIK